MAIAISDIVTTAVQVNDLELLKTVSQKIAKNSGQRLTIIAPDGEIIYDTKKNRDLMDNHSNRPEIKEAFAGRTGTSLRFSNSLNKQLIYLAIPLVADGNIIGVLRHSFIVQELKDVLWNYSWVVFGMTLLMILVMMVLLAMFTNRISESLFRIQQRAQDFSQGNFSTPIHIKKKDSHEVTLLVNSLNEMAKKLDYSFQKITRQRGERESILEGMSEGVLSVYMDENIFHWNETLCQYFNVSFGPDYKGQPVASVFDHPEILRIVKAVKESDTPLEEEISLVDDKTLQVHASMIRYLNHEKLGVVMVFNDITKIRLLENHRREFVANVSHELRTPLTSIQGYVETLLDGTLEIPDIGKNFLKIIEKNSIRLRQIIEDLLALSELDLDNVDENKSFEKVQLNHYVSDLSNDYLKKAQKKDINIVLNNKNELCVFGNPRLLGQAIGNLIDNAIKYGKENSEVKITIVEDSEGHALIQIKDQGAGIDSKHFPRLFERFYSVDKARSRELGGSGLGLSIVKHIANLHDGTVFVESEVGQGSLFTIKIPAIKKAP